ncbi:MAG: adenylate cyclase [Rhodothermales bacterium]|jgi:adenylate cyclase
MSNHIEGNISGMDRNRAVAKSNLEAKIAREAFIATKRHDLRTPINAIIGYGEMILEDMEDEGDEHASDMKRIVLSGHSLLGKINALLDPALIDSGEIDLSDMRALGEKIHLDLRSDINAVVGHSELLLEELEEENADEDVRSDLIKIGESGRRLVEFIEEIVEFVEVMSGQAGMKMGLIETSEEMSDLVSSLRGLAALKLEEQHAPGRILVVDDNEMNRDVLGKRLERSGHEILTACDGREALDVLEKESVDLVLLDIMMPVMDGYQVLVHMKKSDDLRLLPVIVLSAADQLESVVRCIEMGADDFLPKPFNSALLMARVGACIEKKRLRDREQEILEDLRVERENSERLLLNILPASIAARLKAGEETIADSYQEVTVLFSDVVGFTAMSAQVSPTELVIELNKLFRRFDALTIKYGVEKIKTIGDAYMAVGGVPEVVSDHAERVADMALAMQLEMDEYNKDSPTPLQIRIGLNTGTVVAGVAGTAKFAYDLWGDAVNIASRMESTGIAGQIQVSESTASQLRELGFVLEKRGEVEVKGKGIMNTWMLRRRQ